MMKKWSWMFLVLLAGACSDDKNRTTGGEPGNEPESTLDENVMLDQLQIARLEYISSDADSDFYTLTLSSDSETPAMKGTGVFIRFKLAVETEASPFGRYAIGTDAEERVLTSDKDASRYYALENSTVTEQAPLCSGLLTLSKVPGKKPADTRYFVDFTAADDAKTPHTISGKYSGMLTFTEKPGEIRPITTYTLAGVSGYFQEETYTTWGIDFDNADFTKHLAVFSLNAGPGIAEADGIPSGVYTLAEDDAPFTATWVAYDDASQDISMEDLVEGTITIERNGDRYKVAIDAIDYDGAPYKADFEGRFYYENTSDARMFDTREAYAVYYGPVSGGTSWYITLSDRGYLTTGDAVGNYYYGSILHLDLVAEGSATFTDGLPEGTFEVLGVRSGTGIHGGTGSDCTSFLTEYFSGIPTVCKLTGGHVRLSRKGEQVTIVLDEVEMSGDIVTLGGTYTGKIQYIDGRGQ